MHFKDQHGHHVAHNPETLEELDKKGAWWFSNIESVKVPDGR